MPSAGPAVDAVVVGGGFYGTVIAAYLARVRKLSRVVLLEQEDALLRRASFNNQARVHNGYHYPRSYVTAFRSRVNFPKFVADWPEAVERKFTKLYAVARRGSKVSAGQFVRFCRSIGASLQPAPPSLQNLFAPRLIEQAFLAEEYAFDAGALARWASGALARAQVQVRLQHRVTGVHPDAASNGAGLRVMVQRQDAPAEALHCRYLINCTYSGINQLGGDFPRLGISLKHELTEMAYMELDGALNDVGVTVMDGPFFSVMPFPAKRLHSLSHVRYTPRASFIDTAGDSPYGRLDNHAKTSRVEHMVRDVARYIPSFVHARYRGSMFEVKTVLQSNEVDDGRPIVFERHEDLPGCYSVLGAKIDNVYDVLQLLDRQTFAPGGAPCAMH